MHTYRSNCLFFVLKRWWKRGGYVVMRKSRYGWWPHFFWSADLVVFEEFGSVWPPESWALRSVFPPLIFRGRERAVVPSRHPKPLA